jgi:hypothetical protein
VNGWSVAWFLGVVAFTGLMAGCFYLASLVGG